MIRKYSDRNHDIYDFYNLMLSNDDYLTIFLIVICKCDGA